MPAKYKKETVYVTGHGPVRAEIEAWDGALALFKQAARNALIRDALWQGGEYYRTVFVPLKFTNYAKKFGWHVGAAYAKRKQKAGTPPLVWSGELRKQLLEKSRSRAVAAAAKAYVDIIMPGPGYMNATQPVYKTLRSALPEEIIRVAGVVGKAMAENMEGVTSKRGGAAPLRGLSDTQKATFSRSVAPQRRAAPGAPARKAS